MKNSAEINHILFCIAEEAGEVVQATCKTGRFGLFDTYENGKYNIEKMISEFNDLVGAMELLMDYGVKLPGLYSTEAISAKKAKIVSYMKYALHEGVSN